MPTRGQAWRGQLCNAGEHSLSGPVAVPALEMRMYLMYVDESGDSGLQNSPTAYFVLSGLVVHELNWHIYLDQLISFRRRMRGTFGLRLRDEIHASHMINHPGALVRIARNDRLAIIRHLTDELAAMSALSIVNVVVHKPGKGTGVDVFELAWKALFQRFENTLQYGNFPTPAHAHERGIVFADRTDDKKLTMLMRRMRRYNPIANNPSYGDGYRNIPVTRIVEDPCFRDSEHQYFIQAADVVAYLLYQALAPNAYMRRTGGQAYFRRLEPVLCTRASANDPLGIVHL
jgi:hypothetical protein